MIESFFVVFAIFAGYMVYSIVIQPKKAASQAETLKPERKSKPKTAAKPATTAAKASQEVKKEPAKAADEKSQPASVLKNPKTEETANVPNNYRFAKRWIKEALVEEGLLEKIYKNNELDEAASEKVKQAVVELSKMKKYQG